MTAERNLLHGPAADTLAKEAEDLDLLILGSQGYGPVKGALLGSVSARLMKTAPCAVLVFPRGSGADPGRLEPADERQAHRASRRQALGVRLRPGVRDDAQAARQQGPASPR